MNTYSVSYPVVMGNAGQMHAEKPSIIHADKVVLGQTGDALFVKDKALIRGGPSDGQSQGDLVAIVRLFSEIRLVDGTATTSLIK